jgi:hypothetical protein
MTADTIAMMIAMMNEIADHARAAGDGLRGAAGVLGKTLLVSPGWKREMLAKFAKDSPGPSPLDAHSVSRSYMGIPFEVADIPPERVEDWSGCRSPARAKRRAKQGHPQRVKVTFREVAFLVDKAALGRGLTDRFDRMAVKLALGEKG